MVRVVRYCPKRDVASCRGAGEHAALVFAFDVSRPAQRRWLIILIGDLIVVAFTYVVVRRGQVRGLVARAFFRRMLGRPSVTRCRRRFWGRGSRVARRLLLALREWDGVWRVARGCRWYG